MPSTASESAFSWRDTRLAQTDTAPENALAASLRLWRGFMTARISLSLVLVLLHGGIFLMQPTSSLSALGLCLLYFFACLAVHLLFKPMALRKGFDKLWVFTIGVDVLTFSVLQALPSTSINYAPLFALPVLMTAILGSMTLAMGTAAAITLLLLADATWSSLNATSINNGLFLQAALTGAGCFVISFLASQLATKLVDSEIAAEQSKKAALVQRQINAMVIQSMGEGILVADELGLVRLTNPATQHLLGHEQVGGSSPLHLKQREGWQALMDILSLTFAKQEAQSADLAVDHAGEGTRQLWVQTQLTPALASGSERLCVMFIKDQRELQARIRTEKLADMGRMSAAVAHEIRNPLSAIVQANALLAEDLSGTTQLRLTAIVRKNAHRLEKIVHDILGLTQVAQGQEPRRVNPISLCAVCAATCREWEAHNQIGVTLDPDLLDCADVLVDFEPEHLRRILVNLLDNAWRHASKKPGSVWVHTDIANLRHPAQARLHVWSDGAPMEPSVERHLFEPFFSSQSRSSGLGLYICRELCARNGAFISFERMARTHNGQTISGNDFCVTMGTLSAQQTPLTSPSQA